MNTNTIEIARSMESYVRTMRESLHINPETRWETERTRTFIREELKNLGFKPKILDGGIGVGMDVPNATERILFRADFDGLPVQENTGLACASKVPGKMHACGHDVHVAMLLGAMKAIYEGKVKPTKNLRFVFQDAEENPGTAPRPESGGEVLVKEGACDGVSRAYALHISNMPEHKILGAFYSRPGAMMGNSGRLFFKVKSSGGHVMSPATGVNALRVVNAIGNQLNTFIARRFSPIEPATLEPVIVNAGKASNIMPSEADVWYGFRTMLPLDKHMEMAEAVAFEVNRMASAMGAEIAETNLINGHPALINDTVAFHQATALLREAGEIVYQMNPVLGGEDFAHYAMKVPACMFMLGARTPNSGGDHHSPTFNPDESVFWKGVLFWLLLATS